MKKKMIALLVGALMMLSAGSALAAFSGDDLIRVVYNTSGGTVETATDLGSIATLLTDASGTVVGNGAAAFTSNGITSASFANSNVAYFAVSTLENGTTGKYLWVSGDPTNATGISGLKFASVGPAGAIGNLMANYAGAAGANSYVQGDTTTNTYTYFKTLDQSLAGSGILGGFVNTATKGNTEANLATLATTPITQGLWYFAAANNTTAAGTLALTLQTNSDGSTTIINPNATATPIPPSFFLMGSGLLGMFGLRRKQRV